MRQQASGGDGVWRASGSGALRRDLWRRLEKRRAELRREGLGEGEQQPSESLRTLSHRGNTDLGCDSDAGKLSHQVEAALRVPTSPLRTRGALQMAEGMLRPRPC